MARGMPPRSPAGGGRAQPPPRRGGGQAPKTGQRPQKPAQPQKQGQPQKGQPPKGQTQAQKMAQTRHVLEHQRRNAAQAATKKQQHRLRQAQYLREAHTNRRREEAEQRNAQLHEQVTRLESILADGLTRSASIDLETLYQTPELAPFDPGPLGTAAPEPALEDFTRAGGVLGAAWGSKAARARRETAAQQAFQQAREQWRAAEQERAEQLAAAERAHEAEFASQREQVEQYNSRIARVAAGLRTREPQVVQSFLRTVLRQVPLPAEFPRRFEVAYHRDDERVAVRLVLPGPEVVPPISQYEYLASVDEVRVVPRSEESAGELYRSVVAQVALLVVRDVFEAESQLGWVSLQGLADRLDPTTGEPAFASLLRIEIDRKRFAALDLRQSPAQSLAQLAAQLSPDPFGLVPLADPAEPA